MRVGEGRPQTGVRRVRTVQVHGEHVDGGPVRRGAAGAGARIDAARPLLVGRDQAFADRAVGAAVPLELRRDAPRDASAAEDVEAAERRDRALGAHRIHTNRAVPRRGRARGRGRRRSCWRHVVRPRQIYDARGRIVGEVDDQLALAIVRAFVLHRPNSPAVGCPSGGPAPAEGGRRRRASTPARRSR